jgi:hypothetical protein
MSLASCFCSFLLNLAVSVAFEYLKNLRLQVADLNRQEPLKVADLNVQYHLIYLIMHNLNHGISAI